ncbi:hypothetical protein OY671_008111, partial [Metschnikowia pulcherrima]
REHLMRDDDRDLSPGGSARRWFQGARSARGRVVDDDDDIDVIVVRRRPGRSIDHDSIEQPGSRRARRPEGRDATRAPGRPHSARGVASISLGLLSVVLIWWWCVTVTTAMRPGSATARLAITAGTHNAISQSSAPTTGHHVLSIFSRAGETRIVPVPPGTWRVRVIEGRTWAGPRRSFGDGTHIRRYPGSLRLAVAQRLSLSLADPSGEHRP